MTELIITEKPSASQKIAEAIADSKAIVKNEGGVKYYLVTKGKKDIIVVCAVGHLYTATEAVKNGWKYPTFSVKWEQSSKVNKQSDYTAKYLNVIKRLAKECDEFTVATDYDIEGEVIGYNILRFACNQKDGNRMKYSTVTKPDLQKAYDTKDKHLNWGLANAGVTRHELDWYYGINLSRALTLAMKSAGTFKVLSSGRVQGPSLKLIVDKEKEILAFRSTPYWEIELHGDVKEGTLIAWHKEDKFWEKQKAEQVLEKVLGKNGKISEIKKTEFYQEPPTPFDLTTLQVEGYKCTGINPKETLSIAQELYTGGFISYPRTSSQQYPPEIGFKKILEGLARNESYKKLADTLIAKKELKPNNGKKTDPAHPAIFPTGIIPELEGRQFKIYDLIVKRFMATFAEKAKRETVNLTIDINSELFSSKGTRTTEKGWHTYYDPYVMLKDEELPAVTQGEEVKVKKVEMHSKETQPPKRFTPASIIRELEKRNLGTKATRAQIVDTLAQRGYVTGQSLQATELGIKTVETLEKYSPAIQDEALTRHFEEEMDQIESQQKKGSDVLEEAKELLTKILIDFKEKEKEIGEELKQASLETRLKQTTIGKCPKCHAGTLVIKKGKFGFFAACDKYPECTATYKLPSNAAIKVSEKVCTHCGMPMILAIKKAKKPQELCLNPDCHTKKSDDHEANKEAADVENGTIEKQCPKCKEGKLMLRKSIYGQFYGCSSYPKCKYTERIGVPNTAPKTEDSEKIETISKTLITPVLKKKTVKQEKKKIITKDKKETTTKPKKVIKIKK